MKELKTEKGLKDFTLSQIESELERIISFWQEKMLDIENDGFYGQMDNDGRINKTSDKAVILNTRILWTFSASYRISGSPDQKVMAERAYNYLTTYFVDRIHGGVYWNLDYHGLAKSRKKQVYAQAFTIYALAEYYKINPDPKVLELAISIFERIEKHAFDSVHNGYLEALDRDWSPIEDVRLSEKDLNATKTMNTHLHLLEAYTNLYQVWPDERLEKQLRNLIHLMITVFLTNDQQFRLFFNDTWELQSDVLSFGHDIEGGWLLSEAAEVLGDDDLIRNVNAVAVNMTDAALEGLDEDGGLMNEAEGTGIIDTDKHWWPQAEALVGLVNAAEITGEPKYMQQAEVVWQFIQRRLISPIGEWYWKTDRSGNVDFSEDLAGPWKCPYHNGRSMMELMSRLGK